VSPTLAAVKRGFWTHQLVEYILGLFAIAAGAQAPKPLWPCVAGALLLINAACTDGPLAAFKLVPRRLHRLLDDILVVAFLVMAVVAPDIDSTGRVVLVGIAVMLAFITWRTDYATKQKSPTPSGDRSEQFGRAAGRLTGSAISAWKHRKHDS
jgi:hypothetical protein